MTAGFQIRTKVIAGAAYHTKSTIHRPRVRPKQRRKGKGFRCESSVRVVADDQSHVYVCTAQGSKNAGRTEQALNNNKHNKLGTASRTPREVQTKSKTAH